MDGGLTWLMAVNLLVWTGLFLYVLRLHRQLRRLEQATAVDASQQPRTGRSASEGTIR